MVVVSKTVELDPLRSMDIQPDSGGMEVTSVITENDIGVKFVNDNGDETNVMLGGEANLNTRILIDEDNYITLESTHRTDSRTAFVSMEA